MIPVATGQIDSADLGFVLMHEHLAIFTPGVPEAFPFIYDRAAIIDTCVARLVDARDAGVNTIVDVTTVDLGRDPNLIAEASARSGVNVVVATGIWRNVPSCFELDEWTPERLADVFVRELEIGIAASGVRAGIIKVASDEEVTPAQEKVLRAAAIASRQTGAPITTHTRPVHQTGLRQIEVLSDAGADLGRVAIGHTITDDNSYLDKIFAAGCVVSWDCFLTDSIVAPTDRKEAIANLALLLARGRASSTVVGHDYIAYLDSSPIPDEDFTFIHREVIPQLKGAGVTETQIDEVTRGTPARFLDR